MNEPLFKVKANVDAKFKISIFFFFKVANACNILTIARHCPKCFMCVNSFNSQFYKVGTVVIFIPQVRKVRQNLTM